MECEACGKYKSHNELQIHHKFNQDKISKELYPEYIHKSKNFQLVCANCHVSHNSTKLIIWTEIEFCRAFEIEPRSKVGKEIWKRMKENV